MAKPDLSPIINQWARAFNLDPAYVNSIVTQESHGDPNAVNKAKPTDPGAWGAMQVRQQALDDFNAANGTKLTLQDMKDPNKGIQVGTWYLNERLNKWGDPAKAAMAYNLGDGGAAQQQALNPYAQQVMARIKPQQQQASPMLPGIPTLNAAPSTQGGDAFSRAMGSAPAAAGNTNDAFSRAMAAPTQQSLQNAQQTYDPTEGMSGGEKFLAGMGKAFVDTFHGGKQLGAEALNWINPNLVSNQTVQQLRQQADETAQRDAPLMATGAGFAGNIAGNIAATAPLGMVAAPARGASLLRLAATGAGQGTVAGAIAPVGVNDSRTAHMLAGSAAGAVLAPSITALGRAISPSVRPEVQMLQDAGIQPTPGQILGGAAAQTEGRLTSMPGGSAITDAQARAVGQFNRAVYQRALDPIGETLPASVETGSAGVEHVQQAIGKVYKSIEPLASFQEDQPFMNDVNAIRSTLAQESPAAVQTFDNIVKNQITDKLTPEGIMTGKQWGDTRSSIAGLARNRMLGNATPDDRSLASALGDLNDAVNSSVARSSPAEVTAQLQKANAAWAQYKQIEKAAGMVGAMGRDNVFTPAQYLNAVRSGSTLSQRATGNGLNTDFAQAAQDVLGQKYPDSGTAGRLLSGASLAAAIPTKGLSLVPGLLANLGYSQPGQKLAGALLTARPAAAAPVGNLFMRLGGYAPLATPVLFTPSAASQ
jgi:hypothetical protein